MTHKIHLLKSEMVNMQMYHFTNITFVIYTQTTRTLYSSLDTKSACELRWEEDTYCELQVGVIIIWTV